MDFKKISSRDFPDGPLVKNPCCNSENAGLVPGQGTKIPRAAEQLRPRTTATEPARRNYSLCATTKDPT